MEKLTRLFGRSIRFAYHCFDRIVIRGYLTGLSRPEQIAYFFRTVKQEACISKETLRQRTDQYLSWVDAYTRNHEIPLVWAEKDVRKKDDLAPLRTRMQRDGRTGVYYVLKSMEQGPSFRIMKPKFPVEDYPLLETLAKPSCLKSRRVAGIRLENDRMIRLLEILMHSSSQLNGTSAADLHQALLEAYCLTPVQYTRQQLAYDLRKLSAHDLIERPGNRYVYALSDYGRKVAAMLVIVRNRILRPVAGSLFNRPPKLSLKPNSALQAQYRRTTKSFNDLIDLLKAA
ncbi:hypothetical protein D4Q85_00365 [bacterium]|nr:MAG: hypothetical protein D4Q85_00365 [bacterium]